MKRWVVWAVVFLLSWSVRGLAQSCPRVTGATCPFQVNLFIGVVATPERVSPWFQLPDGWVIEEASVLPLTPAFSPHVRAEVERTRNGLTPGGYLAAMQGYVAAAQRRLQSRPLVTPLGDGIPGSPQQWALQPLLSTQTDLQKLGTSPWPQALRVRATFDEFCRTCYYTFTVKGTGRFVGISEQALQPQLTEVNARLNTLPRPVLVMNRCQSSVTLKVAVFRTLEDGSASRFSKSLTVPAGQSAWAPAAGSVPVLTWSQGWSVAVQLQSGSDVNAVRGKANIVNSTVWDGTKGVMVFTWPGVVERDQVTVVLCTP